VEYVRGDHICWFSWRTLTTLVEACGFTVKDWLWYQNEQATPFRVGRASGLIFVCEVADE
jgi:hypothetical protein